MSTIGSVSKLIVTTSWDDGSILDIKLAELLAKYSIKGTFYIPKAYLDNALSEKDIIAMGKQFEIGAHTLNHADLIAVPLEEAEREIRGSKKHLEDLLGRNVTMFSYPYSRYDANIKSMVRQAGFVAARTAHAGYFNLPADPYEWQSTLHASNGSPRMTLKIWLKSGISIRSLFDWEIRARLLFDLAIKRGGIYHMWGHSWEFERKSEWSKLEGVLAYISNREGVQYMTNGEIFGKR